MKKKLPWVATVAIITGILAVVGFASFKIYKYITVTKPYNQAYNTMPETGSYSLVFNEDGSSELSWPEAENANGYLVEVLDSQDPGAEPLFKKNVISGLACRLPEFSEGRNLTVRISSFNIYMAREEERVRFGERAAEYSGELVRPVVTGTETAIDIDTKTVVINYTLDRSTNCVVKGSLDSSVPEILGNDPCCVTVQFGGDSGVSVPSTGDQFVFNLYPQRHEQGFIITGTPRQIFLSRDSFFGRDLNAVCTYVGNGVYIISWDETKGDSYRVQRYDLQNDNWVDAGIYTLEDTREFKTLNHSKADIVRYRVVATGDDKLPGSKFAAESEEIIIYGTVNPLYCTIWPNKALMIFSDPGLTEQTGKSVTALKAYCVLEENGGAFKIRYGSADETGYIDSNYCMINLAEYLGNLCNYNITNSYRSKYLVHEFEIPGVSGTVITGYENVMMGKDALVKRLTEEMKKQTNPIPVEEYVITGDEEEISFLVPYLYPCAKRLAIAAKDALSRGVKLKIYDAYRPNATTKMLYEKVSSILDTEIPEVTFTGIPIEELGLPEGYTWSGGIIDGEQNTEPALPRLTYRIVILSPKPKYALHYFTAQGRSKHNLGVALDLTIQDLATGEELVMQTSINDLSSYSVRDNNGKNANLLSDIMTGAGYSTLVSEWWHYNDLENQEQLAPALMTTGVTPEGWMYDGTGWKYRKINGNYYIKTTKTISGVKYTFDSSGYVSQ